MTRLLLLGAGGLGREVLELARRAGRDVAGFVDDSVPAGTIVDGVAVLGGTGVLAGDSDACVALCVGRPSAPRLRLDVAGRLGLPPERYATLVHPDASVAATTEVGPGSILLAGVTTTAAVRIGAHVVAMPGVVLTHDDVIGDGVTFGARVCLAGGVEIGPGAYLGTGSLVREHVRIGAGAVVGMGAVVLDDVPPGETWVGNPARPIRRAAEVRA